jgi:hypothetical protein
MEKTIQKSEQFIKLCEQYEVDPNNVPEILSVEECYKVRGLVREDVLPDVSKFPERHRNAVIATCDLFIVHEAFNLDPETGKLYEPDWNDDDEQKWSSWWDMEVDKNNPSGFRFYGSACDLVRTLSAGGSRLCSREDDINTFISKHFTPQFKDLMVFSK